MGQWQIRDAHDSRRWRCAGFVAASLVAAGCGLVTSPGDYRVNDDAFSSGAGGAGGAGAGGSNSGGGGGAVTTACQTVRPGTVSLTSVDPASRSVVVVVSLQDVLGGEDLDTLNLVVAYGSYGQEAEYNLAVGDDKLPATCQRCVQIGEDFNAVTKKTAKWYYPSAGSLRLESDPDGTGFTVALADVALAEMAGDLQALSPVAGGACLQLSTFEHRVRSCNAVSDCDEGSLCDPNSMLCVIPQCQVDGTVPCAEGYECRAQREGANEGMCRKECKPFLAGGAPTNECPPELQCVPFDDAENSGLCRHVGKPANGEACEQGVGTSCQDGAWCGYDGSVGGVDTYKCGDICNYFKANATSCPVGQFCGLSNYCREGGASAFNKAVVGASCEAGAIPGETPDNLTYCDFSEAQKRPLGQCSLDAATGDHLCRRVCRVPQVDIFSGDDCGAGFTCQKLDPANDVLGRCQPPPLVEIPTTRER